MTGGTFKNGSNYIITCFKTNQNIEKLRVCFLNNFQKHQFTEVWHRACHSSLGNNGTMMVTRERRQMHSYLVLYLNFFH